MTPQEFVDTLEPAETRRRVAVVVMAPTLTMSRWLTEVRRLAASKFDRYGFRLNPLRLFGYIDGIEEPRLSMVCYDGFKVEPGSIMADVTITEITL